jgi:hypothetical protein
MLHYYHPLWVVQTAVQENSFCKVGQGALGMSLWNQGDGGTKKFGNHWCRGLLRQAVGVLRQGIKL